MIMPRPKGKAKKIAYAILGDPFNEKINKKRIKIDRILVYQNTLRQR